MGCPERAVPDPPLRTPPPQEWQHYGLFRRAKETLAALGAHFRSETQISGINATDIFTLNTALGATIEEQVVESLNNARAVWDPDDEYRTCEFVRQAQAFPDVLLKRHASADGEAEIIMGIELKGWYLLAKEGEPSFRFQVTPQACNPQDLVVVVPWALSNVLSGSPKVFRPYIEYASYAAQYRNYHWQHLRDTRLPREIRSPVGITPYPQKSDPICDQPVSDAGRNFGRFARTGIMDDYLTEARSELVRGIEARHWLAFFRAFQDNAPARAIDRAIERVAHAIAKGKLTSERAEHVDAILTALRALLDEH